MNSDRSSRLRRAMAQGGLARVTSIIGPLAVVPVATRTLGLENYGIYVLAAVGAAVLPGLDLGLRYAMVTRLAAPLAEGETAEARRLSTTTLIATTVLALVLGPLLVLISLVAPWGSLLNLDPVHADALADSLAIVSVGFAAFLPLSLGTTLLLARQRFRSYWLWFAASPIVVVIASIGALALSGEVRWLVASSFVTPTLVAAVPTAMVFHEPDWRPRRGDWSRDALKSLFALGPTISVATFLVAAYGQLDRLLVQLFLGPAAVGVYGLAQRVMSIPQQAITMALQPLWPAFGEALAKGERTWLRHTIDRTQAAMLAVGALTTALFVAVGQEAILILTGPGFETDWQTRAALGLTLTAAIVMAPCAMLLNAAGARAFILLPPLLGIPIAALAGVVLVPRIAEAGAALAAAGGLLLGGAIPMSWYARRLIGSLDPDHDADPTA